MPLSFVPLSLSETPGSRPLTRPHPISYRLLSQEEEKEGQRQGETPRSDGNEQKERGGEAARPGQADPSPGSLREDAGEAGEADGEAGDAASSGLGSPAGGCLGRAWRLESGTVPGCSEEQSEKT